MLAAFALADGEAHPTEIEVIEAACSDWGIPFDKVERALTEHTTEGAAERFMACASAAAVEDREILAAVLCDIAAAAIRSCGLACLTLAKA